MNAIAKYERRHSLPNDDISLDKAGDDSTVASSLSSSYSCERNQTSCESSQSQPLLTGRWRIEETEVSELPEFYPRLSSPLIVRGREVSEIGDNLWSFLRVNDVRSAYDRNEGRVLCCTDRVSFVVQFWRRRIQTNATICPANSDTIIAGNNGTTSNHKFEEEFILEIQRRQGCSWVMQKIRSALKKSILRQQLSNNRHHKNPSFLFPPPPKRSNSYNGIGLIRYKPLIVPCSSELSIERTTSGLLAPSGRSLDDTHKVLVKEHAGSTPSDCDKPGARSIASIHDNEPFPYGTTSTLMAPLRPKFELCPKPHWRRTEAQPPQDHY
jgi:hypothetical protein